MKEERELIAAFGQLATGYDYDKVIGAAANILLNALRQSHKKLGEAEEQLTEIETRMRDALRTHHYHPDGTRNDRRIVLPPLRFLLERTN